MKHMATMEHKPTMRSKVGSLVKMCSGVLLGIGASKQKMKEGIV